MFDYAMSVFHTLWANGKVWFEAYLLVLNKALDTKGFDIVKTTVNKANHLNTITKSFKHTIYFGFEAHLVMSCQSFPVLRFNAGLKKIILECWKLSGLKTIAKKKKHTPTHVQYVHLQMHILKPHNKQPYRFI